MIARWFAARPPRERRLIAIALGIAAAALLVGLPAWGEIELASRRSENAAMHEALNSIEKARPELREHRKKRDEMANRYRTKAEPIAGLLEKAARQQKLDVGDSQDRPPVPAGASKRFTERSTVVHLKKVNLTPLSKFMETLANSTAPTAITRFNLRKRLGEPDSFDVELGLSAFDREDDKPKKGTTP